MNSAKILWVDDEVDLLKPHIMFLRSKGYEVESCNNGYDAIEMITADHYDLVILDEMMPGMTGLETLPYIKEQRPGLPVIMVTKSEEEMIMDKAIGSKIADYIIKPVNPSQVLLSIKKNIHSRRLVSEQTMADYRAEFGRISASLGDADTFADWKHIYKKLVGWEIELSDGDDPSIREVLTYQREEAGVEFAKFVRRGYAGWINNRSADTPVMSHTLMRTNIFPEVESAAADGRKTTLLLIDNFRYDQWLAVRSLIDNLYNVSTEDFYCAILPTATQYARNAIFAGLTPLAIDKLLPDKWLNDNEEGGKNRYEEDFLHRQLQSNGKTWHTTFDKLVRPEQGRRLIENIQRVYDADFSVIVYNFLDILSHARTETEIIRELTEDDAAFRSLTRSWFEHSDLYILLRLLAARGHKVVITSDHGTIRVDNPVKVIADRETSQNLRYKTGKRIGGYNPREVFAATHPEELQLPRGNLSSIYLFATGRDYLIYQNNASQFVRYYRQTFQHGGISMEEMIVPYIVLNPKS
ncbi:MAG: bifunctional response regulator/alkaline phosphatase family protein [Alistipes sp.]|jgi:CheY-like chemotaxis protein|nr:bifunctional response regulator/alkaline phosphatase family protein [Alistipes sp.]